MADTIKVVLAGVNGRMGQASVRAIAQDPELALVGAFGSTGASYVGKDLSELIPGAFQGKAGILVSNDFSGSLDGQKPDVLLDFSRAQSACAHFKEAIKRKIRPVVGVSGIAENELELISKLANTENVGALIVPNFSIGAVLMMDFAKQAAKHFPDVEIIERHHKDKPDAPSGTSRHTAVKMAEMQSTFNKPEVKETELVQGARGGQFKSGLRVHSLRLPGLISAQEVLFGGEGELLSIKHESYNTECFAKGILHALKAVMKLNGMVIGLDRVL